MSDRNLRIQVLLAAIDKVSAPFRAVSKASSATSRAFKETRDQLKALDRSQRDLEGFSQLEQGIVSTNLQLRQARQDAANLGRQFAAVDAPTKSLTNQFNRARDAVARLEVKQRDEIRDLGALKTRLDAPAWPLRALLACKNGSSARPPPLTRCSTSKRPSSPSWASARRA